jgi:predicted AlkP superfamily phosphohydrolase/phosphomutase
MIQRKGEFESEIDREIESSKVHWTEPRSTCDDDGKQVVKDLAAHLVANKEIFESLQEHPEWGCFFKRPKHESENG